MTDSDKTIEVVKAAMEKEQKIQENAKDEVIEEMNTSTDECELYDENIPEDEMEEAEVMNDVDLDSTEDLGNEAGESAVNGSEVKEDKQEKAGKSIFKNSKHNKEMAAKDSKIEELTDRLMRSMAEFDNFRKRSEKEKSQMYDIGVKSMIEKLLPIVDNFERGLGAVTEKERDNSFVQGFELIYKQLMAAFDDIGVKPIEAVGKEFDPALHNAVMHGEDENFGENIITDEFQKGYMYRDMVVRHSMVKVVN